MISVTDQMSGEVNLIDKRAAALKADAEACKLWELCIAGT
jgi:hypothetical protein